MTEFTTPRQAGFRMPAEWEPHDRCWMAWPCRASLWGRYLEDAKEGFAEVARTISRFEPVVMLAAPGQEADARNFCGESVEVVSCELDDSWTRDIAPNFVTRGTELAASHFQFNGWGRKYQRYGRDAAVGHRLAEALGIPGFTSPLYMEGGNINVDGEGTILCSEQCALNPNRNPGFSREEIERMLCDALGGDKVLWVVGDPEDDETDGHVDGIACFVKPGVVMVEHETDTSSYRNAITGKNLRALEGQSDARGREIDIRLIGEAGEVREIGPRYSISYINFYIANGGIVMPGYGISSDDAARETVADAFPGHEIVQVDVRSISIGGGGIHCITQQQPKVDQTS